MTGLRAGRSVVEFFSHCATDPYGPGRSNYRGFTITLRHTTLGRTLLGEGSARHRNLYLTTQRETSIRAAGFGPAIQQAGGRRPTHRAAIRIGQGLVCRQKIVSCLNQCFSTAGPRPGTGPWHQLYRAARRSPGIGHFSFLSLFHE